MKELFEKFERWTQLDPSKEQISNDLMLAAIDDLDGRVSILSVEFIFESTEKDTNKVHETNLKSMEDFSTKWVNIKKTNYDVVFEVTAGELFEASNDLFVTNDPSTGLIFQLNGKEYKRKEYNIFVVFPEKVKLGDLWIRIFKLNDDKEADLGNFTNKTDL